MKPVDEQGLSVSRFLVSPRVLLFIFNGQEILLIKGSEKKKIWPGYYNGIGGHIEIGEDAGEATIRELREETGIDNLGLYLCGTIINEGENNRGILLMVYKGEYSGKTITSSEEGKLEWKNIYELQGLPLVEDIPALLPVVFAHRLGEKPFSGKSYYDGNGKLIIAINKNN